MSDHNERSCTRCGSLLHHEDRCAVPSEVTQLVHDIRAAGCEMCGASVAWFEQICAQCVEGLGQDSPVALILKAASDRGCVIHEETQSGQICGRRALTSGEKGADQLSRFTIILPDTRVVSSVRYEERAAALARVAGALVPYLTQFEPKRRLQ